MPRLNYGTLLENIVVLESTRLALEHLSEGDALGFATSFAMPPITQCWSNVSDEAGSPCFSHDFLLCLSERTSQPASLQAMWSLCIANSAKLPIRCFHETADRLVSDSGGPNGALLAALLAVQSGRAIHLWVNDNGDRYLLKSGADSERDIDELAAAAALLDKQPTGTATWAAGWFPDSISRLSTWLTESEGRAGGIRIGFLDPDNYAEGGTQVSPSDHGEWLRTLAAGCPMVLSVMFSGCQNRGPGNAKRNQRLVSFHNDEAALYPASLVFEYGNVQTGVKVRWRQESLGATVAELERRVRAEWHGWNIALGPLTVHVNGQSGN